MLKKFLREVIINVAGKQSEEIADLLFSKKHVNEFLIAKKLDITINQTRNILYKISDHGLVSSIRKKDKKKGWYTYFWKIEVLKSLEFLKKNLLKRLEQLRNQIKNRETREFYVCERCSIEFNQENALLHDFTCNECGGIFSLKDNTKVLRELKKNSTRIENELKLVEEEIQKEQEKLDKEKDRELKKKKVEKDNKRKEARKKVVKKLAKKIVKTPTRKTPKKKSLKKTGKKIKRKKPKVKVKKKSLKKTKKKLMTKQPKKVSKKRK